ncbi:MAG TPA: hypothetical protein VGP55_09910 [Chitinophagaceae bacterium]|nr:hypothetical protein [Chitinophagaceae bacterium]
MRKYAAELIGTFALVFCGTGAIIINKESGGIITHAGVAITFGLIVMSMIYALGEHFRLSYKSRSDHSFHNCKKVQQ